MRLPQTPDKERPVRKMIHYLTDYYAMKEFDLTPVPFSNYNDNAFYNFYGETTKISGKSSKFNIRWLLLWDCTHGVSIVQYYSDFSSLGKRSKTKLYLP